MKWGVVMRCVECGYKVRKKPTRCPCCGYKFVRKISIFERIFYFIIILISLWLFFGGMATSSNSDGAILLWLFGPMLFAFIVATTVNRPKHQKKNVGSNYDNARPVSAPEKSSFNFGDLKPVRKDSPIKIYNLPRSQAERNASANKLYQTYKLHYQEAVSSDSIALFVKYWNDALVDLDQLSHYEGTLSEYVPDGSFEKMQMDHNFQWKFRDAIEKQIKQLHTDLAGEYRNNKNSRISDLASTMDYYSKYMDSETASFAKSNLQSVVNRYNIPLTFDGETLSKSFSRSSSVSPFDPMQSIDNMDGHDFEYWTANALTNLGYKNVSVTPGSGDQGVDVLAEKDGIKYAIQCKRYTSDLGNTPVQEVFAGKNYYNCHVGVVLTNRYFTQGAKELAQNTGVLLWDRTWISNYLGIPAESYEP